MQQINHTCGDGKRSGLLLFTWVKRRVTNRGPFPLSMLPIFLPSRNKINFFPFAQPKTGFVHDLISSEIVSGVIKPWIFVSMTEAVKAGLGYGIIGSFKLEVRMSVLTSPCCGG